MSNTTPHRWRGRALRIAAATAGTWMLAVSPAAAQPCSGLVWTPASSAGPSARYDHAMVYDGARQKVLLFGGRDTIRFYGDTWEWDSAASSWTLRASGGPSARYGHALAYDPARQKVILFGGRGATSHLGDTWEWDGASGTWTFLSNTGPTPRHYHAMAHDPQRGRTVSFGGIGNGPAHADTWEWDGTTWAHLSNAGPTPRFNLGMAYSPTRHRVVLYGGTDGRLCPADTLGWDGVGWAQFPLASPLGRFSNEAVWDTPNQRLLLFGGTTIGCTPGGGALDEAWSWDGQWLRLSTLGAGPRFGHAAAYDDSAGAVVMHGGAGQSALHGDTQLGRAGVPNDDSPGALPLAPGTLPVDLRCATTGTSGCAPTADLWYRYTATCDGQATATLAGTTFTPALTVFGGHPPGPVVACWSGSGRVATVTWPVTRGTTYSIQAGTSGGPAGTGTLTLSPCNSAGCPPAITVQSQTQRLYYVVGSASGQGWSWCLDWFGGGRGLACDYNVPGAAAGGSAAALVARWVDSIRRHSCPDTRLTARQLPPPNDDKFVVTLGGRQTVVNFAVGPVGQVPTCYLNPVHLCPFNARIGQIELPGDDRDGNGQDDVIDRLDRSDPDIGGDRSPPAAR
jgi:hypothetical protein